MFGVSLHKSYENSLERNILCVCVCVCVCVSVCAPAHICRDAYSMYAFIEFTGLQNTGTTPAQ